jgi:serine phosphatase RsbU (regulator of sigma subunit)
VTRKRLFRFLAGLGLFVLLALIGDAEIPVVSAVATGLAAIGLLLLFGWLALRGLRLFLWRVGRRLAFTYFLIGVLPIPLLALLLGIVGYLLSSFFLGHLYRDAVHELHLELGQAAAARLAATTPPAGDADAGVAFGHYRHGRRVAGSAELPESWPGWVPQAGGSGYDPEVLKERVVPFVARADGRPALAAAAGDAERGVVALFTGDLDTELSERSDVWVELLRSDDPGGKQHLRLQIGARQYDLQPIRPQPQAEEGTRFFGRRARGSRLWDGAFLVWGEITGPFLSLADGAVVSEYVVGTLRATPRMVHRHLFSSNAEVNTAAWAALIAIAFLLFDVYLVAVVMASVMTFGLSRAVNRLSSATRGVAGGDFAVRIPARRKDQVGEMQRSFNRMAEHLQELVASAAEKEALEKELEIARSLQQSLIPSEAVTAEGVEFATHFEPSAAIGGDYFDILRLDRDRLAVVIADVSGHGLSAGLRMAMLKAGLLILVEERHEPAEILRRLDGLVRSSDERRAFVTATLSLLDVRRGTLDITNAGHPPAYHRRGDDVEEIVLPGPPLGRLGRDYGRRRLELEPGDLVVWLSDGLIEATSPAGDPFGYERVRQTIAAAPATPAAVREHLLAAVAAHTGGKPPEDDRTLVVLRYSRPG